MTATLYLISILFVGDSVLGTYGSGTMVVCEYKNNHIHKSCIEIPGATTWELLDEIKKNKPKVDILVFQGGYNDRYGYYYSPTVRKLRGYWIVKALMYPFPRPKYKVEYTMKTIQEIKDYCVANGIRFVPTTISTNPPDGLTELLNLELCLYFKAIKINLKPEHFFDNVHLNESGKKEFARQVEFSCPE